MTSQSNLEAARQQMFEDAKALGENEGRGAVSRATLAVQMVEWAHQGLADVTDAETFYDAYMGRAADLQETFGGTKKQANEANGRKQNVSKFRQFLKMGGNKKFDPTAVIYDAAKLVKEERAKGTIKFAPFDALLNIARKQNHDDYCEDPLPQEVMLTCNQPKVRDDRIEADLLDAHKRKLEKLAEDYPSPEVDEAIEGLAARIEELGGTTKQQKEAAKVAAKKAKEAARANA